MRKRDSISPNLFIWGSVVPNLSYNNLAREILIDAGLDQSIPAFTTVMACSTSMMAAIEAAGLITDDEVALVGRVESMSRVQSGLNQNFSVWLRSLFQSKSIVDKFLKL